MSPALQGCLATLQPPLRSPSNPSWDPQHPSGPPLQPVTFTCPPDLPRVPSNQPWKPQIPLTTQHLLGHCTPLDPPTPPCTPQINPGILTSNPQDTPNPLKDILTPQIHHKIPPKHPLTPWDSLSAPKCNLEISPFQDSPRHLLGPSKPLQTALPPVHPQNPHKHSLEPSNPLQTP